MPTQSSSQLKAALSRTLLFGIGGLLLALLFSSVDQHAQAKRICLLVCEAILLVGLVSLGSASAREALRFHRARRAGAIRSGPYGVGRTIHRSLDAVAFGRATRRRILELALLLLTVVLLAALALVAAIGAFN